MAVRSDQREPLLQHSRLGSPVILLVCLALGLALGFRILLGWLLFGCRLLLGCSFLLAAFPLLLNLLGYRFWNGSVVG